MLNISWSNRLQSMLKMLILSFFGSKSVKTTLLFMMFPYSLLSTLYLSFCHRQGCVCPCVCGRYRIKSTACNPEQEFSLHWLLLLPLSSAVLRVKWPFPLSIDLWLFHWMKPTKTHQTRLRAAMDSFFDQADTANLWDQTLLLQSYSHWRITAQISGSGLGLPLCISVHVQPLYLIPHYILQCLTCCCYIWFCLHRGFTNLYVLNVIPLLSKLLLTVCYRLRLTCHRTGCQVQISISVLKKNDNASGRRWTESSSIVTAWRGASSDGSGVIQVVREALSARSKRDNFHTWLHLLISVSLILLVPLHSAQRSSCY